MWWWWWRGGCETRGGGRYYWIPSSLDSRRHETMTSVVRLLQLVCVLTLAQAAQGTVTVLNATESYQYFTSPNYPSNYPKSQDLYWRIFTDIQDKGVEIDVVDSRIESLSCSYDYVRIYDGSDASARLIQEFCGYSEPRVKSSGQQMYIHFHTDQTVEFRGFRIRYSASPPAPQSSSVNVGLIVGCVFAAIAGLAVIGCIVFCVLQAKKGSKPRVRPNNGNAVAMTTLSGRPGNGYNNHSVFLYGPGQGWVPPPPGGGAVPPPVYYPPPYAQAPPPYSSLGHGQGNTGAPVSGGAPPQGVGAPPYPPQDPQHPLGYPPSAPNAPAPRDQPAPPQTAPPPPGSHPRPITAGFGNTPPAATQREE